MAIFVHEKNADKVAYAFDHASFVSGKTSSEYNWDGVKTIKVMSIITQPLNDYDRTAEGNRYGTPQELQDFQDILSVEQDKSFSIVIDDGNNSEQDMKKQAGRVMQAELAEQVTPFGDKHAFKKWAAAAGQSIGTAEPTKDTVVSILVDIETAMADKLVPNNDRFVYVANKYVGMLRQALTNCDSITDKMLLKGVVGDFGTLHIVGVPAGWLPENVYMLATYKGSVLYPKKLNKTIIHQNPQGYSGNVLEGRFLMDAHVIGAKCDGVVVVADSSKVGVTPVITKGSTTTTIAVTDSGTIKYTTDGSDPRYSNTAETYTAAITNLSAGGVIKAVNKTDGKFGSAVAEYTF